jgi:glycosyltransferase involved in cell wall biosynthesis
MRYKAKKLHAAILDDHITPYRLPLFERLASDQVRVTVLFCSKRFPEREWEVPVELNFEAEILPAWSVPMPRRRSSRSSRRLIVNVTLFWRLIRLNPDVIVGYAFSLPAWTAYFYSRLFRKPYVCWSTDTLHTESLMNAVQRFSRRMIIKRAACCITPSVQGREKFMANGVLPDRIRVAAQTVPADFGAQADRARQDNNTYAHQQRLTGKVILYVGFLTRAKGLEDLIEVFRQIADEYRDAHLLLVGSGPLNQTLTHDVGKLGLKARVHFVGFAHRHSLPQLYAGADVFVFPTHGDTFGVVVAEAIACGLPVVCSRHAGNAGMLVQEGYNGFIVDPRDHNQMKAALLCLLQDDALRSRMSQASIELARRWTIEDAAVEFRSALLTAGDSR